MSQSAEYSASTVPFFTGIRILVAGVLAVSLLADVTFLRDVCLASLGLLLVVESLLVGKWVVHRVPLVDLPLALFAFTVLISLLYATDFSYSFQEVRGELLRNVLLFYVVVNSLRSAREGKWVCGVVLGMGILLMGYGIFDFFQRGGSLTGILPCRAGSFFHDCQFYGTVLIMLAPFYLLLPLWRGRSKATISLLVFTTALLGFSLYTTYVRWVWIVFLLQLVGTALCWGSRRRVVLFAVVAAIVVAAAIPRHLWYHELPRSPVKSSTQARLILYRFSVEQILRSPFRGIGYGRLSFQEAFPDFVQRNVKTMWHAHCLYLNVALQLGIQGLAALLFLFYRILKGWWPWRGGRGSPSFERYFVAAVFVMVVSFLVRNLVDDLYLDTPLNLFWFLLAASYPLLPSSGRAEQKAGAPAPSSGSPGAADRVRILYVFAALPVGGAEKLLYAELRHLDPRRFRPMVCSLRDKGPMGERIEELGVPVVALHRMRSNWIDLKMIRILKDLMVRERIQLVHTHLHDGGRYGRLAARWAGVPCTVATFHNVYVRPRWKHHLINAVLCRWTDRIVAVSQAVKADLIRFDRIPPDRIRVIYNTIDLDRFRKDGNHRALREEYGWGPEHVVMGCVARLEEQKGHIYLIRALARLLPSHAALRLLLVGDGRLRDALEEEVRALRLEAYVRFAGTSDRVPELLGMLDLFVLPSLWEGFPLVLGEAMAAGVPVICTDVGGVREIVVSGETGILIPPGRVEAIERAVESCLKNPDRTRLMAEKARARVERFFSPEAHMQRLEGLYEEVLEAKGIRVPPSSRASAGS